MNINPKNYEALHSFIKGMKGDFDQHGERSESYQNGINGRLYSDDGVLSYSSIQGTKKIYENECIKKYLGFWAFSDELIIFTKCCRDSSGEGGGDIEYETIKRLETKSFEIDIPASNTLQINSLIDANVNYYEVLVPIPGTPDDPINFDIKYSCEIGVDQEIDYSDYFDLNEAVPDFNVCSIDDDSILNPNNELYSDCIYSLSLNNGLIQSKVLWSGNLNFSLNSKVCCVGIFENNFYKRVYFTDYLTPFRVINIQDPDLLSRKPSELTTFQNTVLLEPIVDSIDTNGQIPAGTVFYTYRLITSNGQSTEFSTFTKETLITVDEDNIDFSGGDVSEVTNKSVRIKINIPSWEGYEQVEAVAVEYEAEGAPTSIKSLGVKSTAPVVFFDHTGNEAEFSEDITLTDLLARRNTWKYCSDLISKGNKLIASGLRNDPLPTQLLEMDIDFSLHGWDQNGETHDCLMNPDPEKYRYIPTGNNDTQVIIIKKLYNSIQVFGDFEIKLVNSNTGDFISNTFTGNQQAYTDQTINIAEWLLDEQDNNPNFSTYFPNLKIEYTQNKILFLPIDELIETDMRDYSFEYNNNQVLEDSEQELKFLDLESTSGLIYGAQSLGFNSGNGIRVTYRIEEDDVLEQATDTFPEDSVLLKIKTPSLNKFFMKGEIYRLGLKIHDKDGYELFTIPLGDIMIPRLGDQINFIDESGSPVYLNTMYSNSRKESIYLKSQGVKLKIDVRMNCEVQKLISMYQIVYVERTEQDRTILAQGISAPLERTNIYASSAYVGLKEEVANKWNLPYYGGPTYDYQGLLSYDIDPDQENEVDADKRITTNRSLFYVDSPDIIYSRVSSSSVDSYYIERVGRLNSDHGGNTIRQSYESTYPKFSRKIYREELDGDQEQVPYYVNMTVFSEERPGIEGPLAISKAEFLEKGQITTGEKLGVNQQVSNNALCLGRQAWFYSGYARRSNNCGSQEQGATSELFEANMISPGYPTLIVKTQEDVFTDEFIAQNPLVVDPEVRDPDNNPNIGKTYDTHGIFNITSNNKSSVYGGRTELAFSKNTYIPLGKTIPTLLTSDAMQTFEVYGDTYVSLYIRNKNNYSEIYDVRNHDMNNSGGCENKNEEEENSRYGAWLYACVLETQVESRLTFHERFFKEGEPYDFSNNEIEFVNEAYYQTNNLRTSIPRPFDFKDDPNLGHILAISDPKLYGDSFDAWSEFKVNNFYELEKDQGVAYNLAKQENEIYAIQERQTSIIYIDKTTFVPTTDQESIAVSRGDGTPISDHRVISDFGTSIRRAIVENRFGFCFIDEHQFEFVKINKPLLVQNELYLKFRKLFEQDPIVDTEGYYDDKHKETNIRIRTDLGNAYCLSYNEVFQVFNGWIEYNEDIYMVWNNHIFAPLTENSEDEENISSKSLYELNEGLYLNFFEDQKTMTLGITCNINPTTVKIFKHWEGILNIDYNIKEIRINTKLGQNRVILGDHHRYKIREGRHSVPLKNRLDWDDLRGEWAYLEVEIESKNNSKIDCFSFINFVRDSYQ